MDLWPSHLFLQPQLKTIVIYTRKRTRCNFAVPGLKQVDSLAGSRCHRHVPDTRLQPLSKKTQAYEKAPPQAPVQAQLLPRSFWSYRLGQNLPHACLFMFCLMHETKDMKHETLHVCNDLVPHECMCLMSVPHAPHVNASCASCFMCLMHVSYACASCMASCMCLMHGLMHVPHACASCPCLMHACA